MQKKIRARMARQGVYRLKYLNAAAPVAAFLGAVLLFAQSAFRVAAGSSIEGELLSLGLPGVYTRSEQAAGATPPPGEEDIPSPILLERADIDLGVSESVRIELMQAGELLQVPVDLSGSEPRILIYHTHTTEAYFPTAKDAYEPAGAWRTRDNRKNIVAVGERLKELLSDRYGINVIHDITDHEPPKLSTAYSRSVETMERYRAEHPSITMYIDVHRDAYGTEPQKNSDYIVIDGKEVARLMFVVGTGEGATGTGFGEKPDFAANYALAKRLTDYLAGVDERLVRNIRVKTGRYNQHISNQCLLVEVGHNANTLTQALNAVEYLAEAIAQVGGVAVPAAEPGGMLELAP